MVGRGVERTIDSCPGDGKRVGNDVAARTRSGQLFYEFGVDEMIPTDHLFTTDQCACDGGSDGFAPLARRFTAPLAGPKLISS
jgi:hypothetical protein